MKLLNVLIVENHEHHGKLARDSIRDALGCNLAAGQVQSPLVANSLIDFRMDNDGLELGPEIYDADIVVLDYQLDTGNHGWGLAPRWTQDNRLVVLKSAVLEDPGTMGPPKPGTTRIDGTGWASQLGLATRTWLESEAGRQRLARRFKRVQVPSNLDTNLRRQLDQARLLMEHLWISALQATDKDRTRLARHAKTAAAITGRVLRAQLELPDDKAVYFEDVSPDTNLVPWEALAYSHRIDRRVPCVRVVKTTVPLDRRNDCRRFVLVHTDDVEGPLHADALEKALKVINMIPRAPKSAPATITVRTLDSLADQPVEGSVVQLSFHGPDTPPSEGDADGWTGDDFIQRFIDPVLACKPSVLVLYGCNSAFLLRAQSDMHNCTVLQHIFGEGVQTVVAMQAIVGLRELATRWMFAFYAGLYALRDSGIAAGLAREYASQGPGLSSLDLAFTVFTRSTE